MNTLLVLLYSISAITSLIGLMQFIQLPHNKANRFLGAAMLLIGLGIFQSSYFMEPISTRIHAILLLPLNLIFLPYFFSIKYIESFAQQELLPAKLLGTIKYIALGEVCAHLLPLGVIIFTGEYSRALLDFLFRIRNIVYITFIGLSFFAAIQGSISIGKIHTQDGLDKNIYWGIRLFLIMTAIVAILIGVSVIVPMIIRVDRIIFYIPQITIGIYFISWGIYNTIINQNIANALIDEYRNTRKIDNSYYTQLLSLLEKEKIYRNPNLRISDISEKLSISPNYLSRIINETSDDGFSDLINRHRVSELIEKIKNKEYQSKTLLTLAMEVGFSSKSTFQSAFKKITGKTPSEYKSEVEKL